ncbi:MAG: thiamine diphosphokinase [Eubacteriales bacterium]|nr:thiamine diphosphokinase [Eubacteriales bacterium]
MDICYIVGAGAFTARDFTPDSGDYVIAADGGYRYVKAQGREPQLLLGDFDSLGALPENLPDSVRVKRFAVEKDDTDTGIALQTGYELGYRSFRLYGCGGGRLDHLFANMQCMGRYQKLGASVRLIDPSYDLYALHNQRLELPPRPLDTLVSVFCHGNSASGVNLEGLQYPLHNATLTCDYPLGVSNHYADERAAVSVEKGTLLVMVYLTPQG